MNHADNLASLVDAWLADEQSSIDGDYCRLMALLNRRRAGQSWHKHGTFRDHLVSVYRMLKLWGQDRETCLCGLFHSVYSNEYVDLALFDPDTGRDVLASEVGAECEELIYRFCTVPRTAFVLKLLALDRLPDDGLELQHGGKTWFITPREIAVFTVVTVADLVEQWYSWQEDTMASYPHTGQLDAQPHWAATLWPGPFRPGTSALSLASRLARHLRSTDIPVPPIFDRCSAVLAESDEAAASALYSQVTSLNIPLVDCEHARRLLQTTIEHNPWVGEPYLQLAQISLMQGDFSGAHQLGTLGLQHLMRWGVQWDKRISWEGWIVWARMLVQRAEDRRWPGILRSFNNLGLVRPSPRLQDTDVATSQNEKACHVAE